MCVLEKAGSQVGVGAMQFTIVIAQRHYTQRLEWELM